jgi:hypothetical protein
VWPSRSHESLCSPGGIYVPAILKGSVFPWAVVEGSESSAILEESAHPLHYLSGSPAPLHRPRGICIWYHPGGVLIILCHPGGMCIFHVPYWRSLHNQHTIPEGSASSSCHPRRVWSFLVPSWRGLHHLEASWRVRFLLPWDILEGSASFLHHIQGICILRPFGWDLPVELSVRKHGSYLSLAGWLGTRIIYCARCWGPELCLAWSQQGHPLTSLAGYWIMPSGSMGTCVMSWCIVPLLPSLWNLSPLFTILVET